MNETTMSRPVVLLHGLARGPWSMALLGRRLERAGFEVHNLGYAGRPQSLDQVLDGVQRQLDARGLLGQPLDWATYSLGCLVARSLMERRAVGGGGRTVMLAPPNHGSEIVDTLGKFRVFRLLLGELAAQLGTDDGSLPSSLGKPPSEVGVIAGSRWINPLGLLLLNGEHDGSVRVESTRLDGMRDHIVVPHTHSFLMNSPRVAREIECFLRQGRFERDAASAA